MNKLTRYLICIMLLNILSSINNHKHHLNNIKKINNSIYVHKVTNSRVNNIKRMIKGVKKSDNLKRLLYKYKQIVKQYNVNVHKCPKIDPIMIPTPTISKCDIWRNRGSRLAYLLIKIAIRLKTARACTLKKRVYCNIFFNHPKGAILRLCKKLLFARKCYIDGFKRTVDDNVICLIRRNRVCKRIRKFNSNKLIKKRIIKEIGYIRQAQLK